MNIIKIINEELIKYLNEASGTPNVINLFVDDLVEAFSEEIHSLFIDMEKSDNSRKSITKSKFFGKVETAVKSKNKDEQVEINFPVDNVRLNLNLTLYKNKLAISGLANRNLGIKNDFLNPEIDLDIYGNSSISKEEIEDKLHDVLIHEMTHIYEFYEREKGNVQTRGDLLNYITANEMGKDYPREWRDFLSLIYYSIDFEINARVSQASTLSKRLRDKGLSQGEIMEKIKGEDFWKVYEKWMSFDAGEFIEKMDNLYDGQGLRRIRGFKNKMTSMFSGSNVYLRPEDVNFISDTQKMSPEEFLKFWEVEFKKKAKRYKNKILKVVGTV